MSAGTLHLRWFAVAVLNIALAAMVGTSGVREGAGADLAESGYVVPVAGAAALPPRVPAPSMVFGDSLLGLSGALRIRLVPARDLPPLVGDEQPASPGVYPVPEGIGGHRFALVGVQSFSRKVGAFIGGYYVGYWPAELHRVRSSAYAPPDGFVEVTRANEDLRLSEHFRLRDFLTHDQPEVWPKYVVLREALLDKLELVLADLAHHGINTSHVVVLSGFRTPAYNLALGDASGRARESRHQYGDAADIIIDANRDGRMDDLNLDGRVDRGDVRVIERAVERVEHRYPELAGGLGLYDAEGPRGPVAHIDVRGESARWTRWRRPHVALAWNGGDPRRATAVSGCYATGPSAVLCARVRRGVP